MKIPELCDVEKMKQKGAQTFIFEGFFKIHTTSQYFALQKFKCLVA